MKSLLLLMALGPAVVLAAPPNGPVQSGIHRLVERLALNIGADGSPIDDRWRCCPSRPPIPPAPSSASGA